MDKEKTTLADLNQDVLGEILKRSVNGSGGSDGSSGMRSYITFSKVCTSWRSAAAANPYKPVLPWLMLSNPDPPTTLETPLSFSNRSFLSPGDKQVHEIKFEDDAYCSWCCGSSEGWLVMAHPTSGNFLYNPITRGRIRLPSHSAPNIVTIDDEKTIRPERPLYLSKAIVITSSSLDASYSSSSSRQQLNRRKPLHDDPTKMEEQLLSSSPFGDDDIDLKELEFSQDYCPDIVLVVAIFAQNNVIGFCRPGATKWELLQSFPYRDNPYLTTSDDLNGENEDEDEAVVEERLKYPRFDDIILYRGALYLVTHGTAKLGVIHFSTRTTGTKGEDKPVTVRPRIQWIKKLPKKCVSDKLVTVTPRIKWLKMLPEKRKMIGSDWNYLVESYGSNGAGDLLMVVRLRRQRPLLADSNRRHLETSDFLVFRLDESSDPIKWVKIDSLGDQILFLGTNHSKSIPASDSTLALAGNCIYFTKDFSWQRQWLESSLNNSSDPRFMCNNDVGVFYLENKKIETSFHVIDNNGKEDIMKFPTASVLYPAIFFTPNPSSYNPGREDMAEYLWRYSIPILGSIALFGIGLICQMKHRAWVNETNYIFYKVYTPY